jgi:transposase
MDEVSQPMDTQEEDAIGDSFLVPLRTLMDIDTIVEPRQVPLAAPRVTVESYAEMVRKWKLRGPYRRYTAHQIEQLFDCVIKQGKAAKEAALLTGISIRTVQHYINKYNDGEEGHLPISGRRPGAGCKTKLTECHSQFLIGYVDEHPEARLSDTRRAMCEAFRYLSISISHYVDTRFRDVGWRAQNLEKLLSARNNNRVLRLLRETVENGKRLLR